MPVVFGRDGSRFCSSCSRVQLGMMMDGCSRSRLLRAVVPPLRVPMSSTEGTMVPDVAHESGSSRHDCMAGAERKKKSHTNTACAALMAGQSALVAESSEPSEAYL
jgi:hypothetical protein